ncbi:hypothetical protein OsJ_35876 [Oryza sativa Japonica Group]|uniref:Uncharacterized protein n=1 Tax=Oryza sativa subsp. japonica TaxID=39947 RepID=A3CGQ9_ORYSJ|nr:hypothetical protein OsJ_35876 [Oryza sativa Japonica Group]
MPLLPTPARPQPTPPPTTTRPAVADACTSPADATAAQRQPLLARPSPTPARPQPMPPTATAADPFSSPADAAAARCRPLLARLSPIPACPQADAAARHRPTPPQPTPASPQQTPPLPDTDPCSPGHRRSLLVPSRRGHPTLTDAATTDPCSSPADATVGARRQPLLVPADAIGLPLFFSTCMTCGTRLSAGLGISKATSV